LAYACWRSPGLDIWHLPIWVQQGYKLLLSEQRELVKVLRIARDSEHPLRQQNRLDDDPTLRRWLNQPANTVLLANGLALSAQQAWDSPHSQRWQYLTSLYLQIRWKKCSSSCTSKPPTVRASTPCPICGTRPKR
jgi:hypothetical protein